MLDKIYHDISHYYISYILSIYHGILFRAYMFCNHHPAHVPTVPTPPSDARSARAKCSLSPVNCESAPSQDLTLCRTCWGLGVPTGELEIYGDLRIGILIKIGKNIYKEL